AAPAPDVIRPLPWPCWGRRRGPLPCRQIAACRRRSARRLGHSFVMGPGREQERSARREWSAAFRYSKVEALAAELASGVGPVGPARYRCAAAPSTCGAARTRRRLTAGLPG